MKKTLSVIVCAIVLTSLGLKVGDTPAQQMQQFADSFLESLNEKQRSEALMPYESAERSAWHFIPKPDRKGVPLGEMDEAQRTAALRLVRAALSEAGYDKTQRVMLIEGVVRDLEGEGRQWPRDPNLYYATVFGKPSATDVWGLSFEGHHVSLNFVCRDGVIVDSTPQFLGAHPGTIPSDYKGALPGGTRILHDEEELAFQMVNAMDEKLKTKAIIDSEAPKELRFAGEPQSKVEDKVEGVAYGELPSELQQRLQHLVSIYIDLVADPIAKDRNARIEKDGWDKVHFAWSGATEPGIGHYYRIQGPSFLIEFVNSQPDALGNPANHVHCVFRDLTGDFDLPIR
jgi:Protein of unknown function (DUF3500)